MEVSARTHRCACAEIFWFFVAVADLLSSFFDKSLHKSEPNEAAALDNIERRFAWLRRLLGKHETDSAKFFPEDWKVGWALVAAFIDITRCELLGANPIFHLEIALICLGFFNLGMICRRYCLRQQQQGN